MKILLLGATGRLGWELQRALAPLGPVVTSSRRGGDVPCDLAEPGAAATLAHRVRPQVIVNAAADTAVDAAEHAPAHAQALNAAAPGELAQAAAALQAWLVHYSSDYVFDGHGDAPFDETAVPAPLNAHGRSKLDGEQRVRASGCRHLILRTSWLHAPRGDNFARAILRGAAQHAQIDVVDDQIGSPTGAELLADVTAHALRAALAEPALAGTYHVAAAGHASRYDVARAVVDWARAHGRRLALRPDGLHPIRTAATARPAPRPLNSRLATGKLCRSFGLSLPPWQAGLQRMLAEAGSD